MNRVYDVAIIGAGPCGIVSAIELGKNGQTVALIERGKNYADRLCLVDQRERCANCSPCNVISGYGGCVHYGDSAKLSMYPSGKELYRILGEEEYYKLLDRACQYWEIDKNKSFQNPQLKGNSLLEIKNYPVCIVDSNKIKSIVQKSYEWLIEQKDIDMQLNTNVIDIENQEDIFVLSLKEKDKTIRAKKVILAVGRGGLFWLKNSLNDWKVLNEEPEASIGVRFEMPKEYLKEMGKKHPDLKIRALVGNKKAKTFCFCAGENGGRIKEMNYGDFSLLDGHILTDVDIDNGRANFALLMKLRKPIENNQTYTDYINECLEKYRSLNKKNPGKPICQKYLEFRDKIQQENKLYDGVASVIEISYGDVYKLFQPDELKEYCLIAEEIFRYIWSNTSKEKSYEEFLNEILVIGLEMEGLWNKVEVNSQLESNSVQGLYFGGDCAGGTQGILQATISGLKIAEAILIENGKRETEGVRPH